MNAQVVILRIVWLLFGLTAGYDISKIINQENYELSLLLYLPAFFALMVGEFLYARMASGKEKSTASVNLPEG